MNNQKPVLTSMAINARLTLSLQALNNEGTQGNARLIRRVNIIDPERKVPVSVNAISREMLKHMAFEHLVSIAKREKMELSSVAAAFNPMRAGQHLQRGLEATESVDRLTEAIKTCVADDILGFLELREGRGNIPRKSLIEFGWMPAIPGKGLIESKEHSRFTNDTQADKKDNLGQMRFAMEIASGDYAFTSFFDIAGVGYNQEEPEKDSYVISIEERYKRIALGLESIYQTLLCPVGASRSACLCHIHGISGAITLGFNHSPAPSISPLETNYIASLHEIVQCINNGFFPAEKVEEKKQNSHILLFNNFAELGTQIQGIIKGINPTSNNEQLYSLQANNLGGE